MANTPIIKKRNGAFSVAVFEETKQGKSGEYISRSVVLQKSYKDQNDQWQRQTINMFDNNVAEVATLLQATAIDLISLASMKPVPVEKSERLDVSKTPELDAEIPF